MIIFWYTLDMDELQKKKQWTMIISGLVAFAGAEAIAFVSAPRALKSFVSRDSTPEEGLAALLAVLLVFFSFLVLVRYFRERNLLGFFFFISLFFGLYFLFGLYLPAIPALAFSLLLILSKALGRRVITQNLALLPGLAGIGVAVGLSFTPYGALLLLAALSVYDIIAVYFTKHMVALFRNMLKGGVIPAIIIPEKFSGLIQKIEDIKPGAGFMLIGTGDLALPTIFVVAVSGVGTSASLASGLGSMIGFVATELIFTHQRFRRPMPALPPIATGTILGFLVERLLY
ncbi:hypothetical protein HYT45_00800 [Candidatus Uhrbacteria bacterium]|nr:hypothetical protein [Candidatus Uhrbacteria bacterium]